VVCGVLAVVAIHLLVLVIPPESPFRDILIIDTGLLVFAVLMLGGFECEHQADKLRGRG
jgi:hypothetical protein